MTEASVDGASPAELLERQNRELGILNAIASRLNESVDLGDLLGATIARVTELLGLRTAWVWILDDRTKRFELAAAQNLPTGMEEHPESLTGPCLCLRAFRRGALHSAVNVLTCSRLRALPDGTEGLHVHASIPLQARGKQLGVMNVAATEWRELSSDELRVLHTIGEMLGTAVERARLFRRSAQLGAAEERLRLAREIHDNLAQRLSATALHLEAADALLDAGADLARVRDAVHHALTMTRQNLDDARRSVLDLRASTLEGRTLTDAVADLCRGRESEGATVTFLARGVAPALPARVEGALYRITQEALANALRHASATRVDVCLEFRDRDIQLSIADDGHGFDPATTPADHFGLIGMRERARLLGGELHVESSVGGGTRVVARVPVR